MAYISYEIDIAVILSNKSILVANLLDPDHFEYGAWSRLKIT
jgi:hypothetical protein